MTENTIQTITAEHAGATLDVTVPGETTTNMLSWTLPGLGLTIDTDRLLLDGGMLAGYNPENRQAQVTLRGTVGAAGNRFILPSGERTYIDALNSVKTAACVVAAAVALDHVSLETGLYACATHRDDGLGAHFFVVGRMHETGVGGVSQLSVNSCHGTTGDGHQFDDYRTCRPQTGATHHILFNGPPTTVLVKVVDGQFPNLPRVAGPAS